MKCKVCGGAMQKTNQYFNMPSAWWCPDCGNVVNPTKSKAKGGLKKSKKISDAGPVREWS